MKKLNFSTMTKFTGDEVGKLMLKDYLTGIISGLNDRDIAEGNKPVIHLLEEAEIDQIMNNLTGTFNIAIYNDYRELMIFIKNISIEQMIYAYSIEIGLWKLAHRIQCRDRFPIEEEDIKGMEKAVNELNKTVKKFFFIEAVKEVMAEFTQIEEILHTLTAFPDDLFQYVNHLIDGYNLINRADILPMIEKTPVTEEKIREALKEIQEVSTLYDEKILKVLLVPEVKETCIVGGKEDEEY